MQRGKQTKNEIRTEIHEMNLVVWGFILNFGGGASKKSWRRERNTTGLGGTWVPRVLL